MDLDSGDKKKMVQYLIDYCDGTSSSSTTTMCNTPSNLRFQSPSSFEPRVVSIGPLHKGSEKLQRFERRKAEFVKRLLDYTSNRTGQSLTQILTACVEKVTSSIKKIQRSYDSNPAHDDFIFVDDFKANYRMSVDELGEFMIKDACFILQFILEISDLDGAYMFMSLDTYIYYDLLLLQNQIPFFVLNDIYECTLWQFQEHMSLTEFVLPLLRYPNLFQREIVPVTICSYTEYDHILGYLHDCYKPRTHIEPRFPKSTIRSAVELERAGVKLISNKNADWPLAIDYVKMRRWWCTFWFLSKPTLKMPTLRMNQFTELVFINLIAYEQSKGVSSHFTSYVKAMGMLVNTHDIDVLVRSKVIINHYGSNGDAAIMINGICREGVWEYFYYSDEWEKLDTHFTGYWSNKLVNLHLWMDNFRRTYFSSPWNIIALLAGITLFGLTLVQTIFAVKYAGK